MSFMTHVRRAHQQVEDALFWCNNAIFARNSAFQGGTVSGFQLSGDAPTAYTRFALKIVEPWTDDLILTAGCRDGDRVLDVACGTGVVASRVNLVSRKLCYVTGIRHQRGHA